MKARHLTCLLAVLLIASFVAGCGQGTATATPTPPPTRTPQPTEPPSPPSPTPACPPANGTGATPPDVAVLSVTFVVNGREQVVRAGGALTVSPGDAVQVREVAVCADPFARGGGEVCVELTPLDANSRALTTDAMGTHMRPMIPGVVSIPGPGDTWTIGEDWRQISVEVNHWPPDGSSDPSCGGGRCEHDDEVLVELRK